MNIILLSGGSGKRLWPLSNDIRSKQFLKILSKPDGSRESMAQRMYRMIRAVDPDATITEGSGKLVLDDVVTDVSRGFDASIEFGH